MNMPKIAAAALIVSTIAVGRPALNWAQESSPEPSYGLEREMRQQEVIIRKAAAQAEQAAKQAAKAAEFKMKYVFGGRQMSDSLEIKIREAAGQVRDAQDEVAKSDAVKQLVSLLDRYFEDDMQARTKELQDIQTRLQKLQQQLDRRRAKKQEIIDLQLKVALNEAEGLGFYSEPKSEMFNIRVPAPMRVPIEVGDDDLIYGTSLPRAPSADAAPQYGYGGAPAPQYGGAPVPTTPVPPPPPAVEAAAR